MSANSFGAYFVDYLLHPHEKTNHQVTVYGTGEAKGELSLLIILFFLIFHTARHILFDSRIVKIK